MNLIVNVDANWAIGCKGKLLFPISADLKRFAQLTTGKVVVMGRATLESLPGGKPLKNRENIVLSRSLCACGADSAVKNSAIKSAATNNSAPQSAAHIMPLSGGSPENLSFCASVDELRRLLASARFERFLPSDIFVIGGQSVYEQLLADCDTAFITRVEAAAPQADSFFPNLDKLPEWKAAETSQTFFQNTLPYCYITYRKTAPNSASGADR